MTQYNTLNVNFSNSQLNKLESGIKNKTEVTLNYSSNLIIIIIILMITNKTNFPHKVLLTGSFKFELLQMVQLSKIVQLGGVLCDIFLSAASKEQF